MVRAGGETRTGVGRAGGGKIENDNENENENDLGVRRCRGEGGKKRMKEEG
jgi:hypothetical protein